MIGITTHSQVWFVNEWAVRGSETWRSHIVSMTLRALWTKTRLFSKIFRQTMVGRKDGVRGPCVRTFMWKAWRTSSPPSPMFTHQGLFKSLACPDRGTCNRPRCLYSHASNILPTRLPQFIIKAPLPITQATIPIKRTVVQTASPPTPEPPRKFQKVGTFQRPLAVPSASHSEVRSIYIIPSPWIN